MVYMVFERPKSCFKLATLADPFFYSLNRLIQQQLSTDFVLEVV